MPSSFHVLIKPASSLCNISCDYCFYDDVSKRQTNMNRKIMSEAVMDAVINQSLEMSPSGYVTFGFQGGEPLIAPLSFYQLFVNRVNALNTKQAIISYTLQTNGMLITAKHAVFFRDNGFLIGVSLDGEKETHDRFRKTFNGQGSYEKALTGIKILNQYEVPFNVLTVLTEYSVNIILDTYQALKTIGISHLQFIPVIEEIANPKLASYALSQEGYQTIQISLFDAYVQDKLNRTDVHIRYFDNLLSMINGRRFEQCGLSGKCHSPLIVESQGNVYPCDFYSDDEHLLGNVLNEPMRLLVKKEIMKSFIIDSLKIPEKCQTCDVYDLCRGGCRRYRIDSLVRADLELMHCVGVQVFLRHVKEKVRTIGTSL
jgi:uncharacterized protein